MPEYRIATNGDRYRIEKKRGFLSGWEKASKQHVKRPARIPKDAPDDFGYIGYMDEINKTWDDRNLEETQEILRLVIEWEDRRQAQKARKWRSL